MAGLAFIGALGPVAVVLRLVLLHLLEISMTLLLEMGVTLLVGDFFAIGVVHCLTFILRHLIAVLLIPRLADLLGREGALVLVDRLAVCRRLVVANALLI